MTPRALLQVTGLAKSYGRHRVLDGVSFELAAGAVSVLAGTNGAGKSTLLRCLAGLTRFEGTATVGGRVLDAAPASRRLVGYVPQRVSLPESGTVAEMLALFASLRGASDGRLLFPEGFLPPGGTKLGVLSGGQQQRVVLAAALLGEPPLLLLDEPAANLDEVGRAQLWAGLRAAADGGAAVLVASPSPGDLTGVASRVLVLEQGRLAVGEARRGLHAVPAPGGAPGDAVGAAPGSDGFEGREVAG